MPNIDVLTMENLARNQNWAKVFSTLNENFQKMNNFVTYILDATLTKAQSWTATGGAQTFQTSESFTLGTRKLFVFVDGQRLSLRTHYYEVSSNKFRIIDPQILPEGAKVLALITEQYKTPEYSTVLAVEHLTATSNQSVFTLTNEYVPGQNMLEVYVEGARQWPTTGFAETSGLSFTLTEGLDAGTEVLAVINYIPGTIAIERFTATANQELFTLANNTYEVGSDTLEVYRDGVHQWTTSGYTETSSSSFTVVGACDAGTDIVAVITKTTGERHVEKFVATEGQTAFTLTHSNIRGVNLLDVYVNNVRQWPITGFTETSDTVFTLTAACAAGDEVVAIVKR